MHPTQRDLSSETTEPPEAMIVASPSPDRASVFSMCFPKEIPDYDLPMDLGDGSDGVILPDTHMDEMDMIGTGHILDVPHLGLDLLLTCLGFLCLSLMVMDLLLLILLMILFLFRERSTLWTHLFLLTLCQGLSPALMIFLMVIMI